MANAALQLEAADNSTILQCGYNAHTYARARTHTHAHTHTHCKF